MSDDHKAPEQWRTTTSEERKQLDALPVAPPEATSWSPEKLATALAEATPPITAVTNSSSHTSEPAATGSTPGSRSGAP